MWLLVWLCVVGLVGPSGLCCFAGSVGVVSVVGVDVCLVGGLISLDALVVGCVVWDCSFGSVGCFGCVGVVGLVGVCVWVCLVGSVGLVCLVAFIALVGCVVLVDLVCAVGCLRVVVGSVGCVIWIVC